MAIDILAHNDGICHSGLEGEPVEIARCILVLVACTLQYLHKSGANDPNTGPSTIKDMADGFSFNEIKKTLHTRFCSILCDAVNDKDALLKSGGLILPFKEMALFLTFSPIADDTIRTSLPKKIRLALRSHQSLFY